MAFQSTRGEFGGLSNMAPGFPIVIGDACVRTSEALYQALRFPNAPHIQSEILNKASPMTAKMVSRRNIGHTRNDWPKVRVNIMRWCLRAKLARNYDRFGDLLLATGSMPIVERSRKDTYWGAKPSVHGEEILSGRNVLGRLLMELRELLRAGKRRDFECLASPEIADFLLFGRRIPALDPDTCAPVVQDEDQSSMF